MSTSAPSSVVQYPSTGRLRALPRAARHIMIVDDHAKFPGLLKANLNILHNYASDISVLKSLGRALDELRVRCPDLFFVRDELRPCISFSQIHGYVRQAGYTGPIIACVTDGTREKRKALMGCGATFVLDRDETHTAAIVELLSQCLIERAIEIAPSRQ